MRLIFSLSFIIFALFPALAIADTPPPNTVKAKLFSGDGATSITATGTSLNVNVTNSGGTSTVNQGNAGVQSWLTQVTSSALPTGASTSANQATANGYLSSIDLKLTSPLAVSQSGTWTTGRTWSLSTGSASVAVGSLPSIPAGSNAIGSVSVSNFPATQPISATSLPLPTGAATESTLSAINTKIPASPSQEHTSAASPHSARLSDGSSFYDARQVRTLTNTDTVTVVQPTGTDLHVVVDSSALPTGAATAANQATANSSLSSIDSKLTSPLSVTPNAGTNLNTSALGLDATVSGQQVNQGSTTSGQKGTLVQGAVTTNQPTYTTAQTSPISLNTRGGLRSKLTGYDSVNLIRNDYSSTNVTTGAYVQLVASTSGDINRLHIFDSSGQDFVLAVGGSGSEVDQVQISPGGWDAPMDIFIPSGSRISIKAVSATASSGILLITGLK